MTGAEIVEASGMPLSSVSGIRSRIDWAACRLPLLRPRLWVVARHLLVLLLGDATRTDLEAAVEASGQEDVAVYIVAPSHVGPLDWLATDEDQAHHEAATRVLDAEWLLAGISELGGEAGEADPVVAVTDALQRFPADEIVVVGSGTIDPPLVASIRSLGLPVSLSGVAVGSDSAGSRVRAFGRAFSSGRSSGTPFLAFVAANLGLLLIALVGALLVALVVWLIGVL
jgi:hypothetical protein